MPDKKPHPAHQQQAVEKRRAWQPGDPCGACGSTDTYGYDGNAGCRGCGAHDQDGG